ncbi:MAG: SDR family oxidoreductase, partial [Planctomycetota bacterium]
MAPTTAAPLGELRWIQGEGAQAHAPLAVVTGAARRVGAAVALELARAGCQVIGTCLASVEEIERTMRTALEEGAPAAGWLRLDLDRPAHAAVLLEQALRPLSRLDVLVHNAAVYEPSPVGSIDEEQALRTLRVNALAPLLLTQA